MKSINPANGEIIKEYEKFSKDKINEAIEKSHKSFLKWRQEDIEDRCEKLKKVKNILLDKKSKLAKLMAIEMGKPLSEGEAEIEKCAWLCEYYADHAKDFLKPESVQTDYKSSEIHFSPIGIILAVMPWNYPFWQVFRFAAPNLVAGNVGILKHASNVSGCALEIENIFHEAGFPKGVFTTLLADKDKIEDIIKDRRVRGVTLTGSTAAGKSIAKIAGENLKKSVLELGGSDPYIILEDADLDNAVDKCAASRLLNGGQSCISAKRFIVMSEVYDEFISKLKVKMKNKKVGDPLKEGIDIGPMARSDLRDELHKQVISTISSGGRCVLGGEVDLSNKGAFYPPTIIADVIKGMCAYSEELFGPVAVVIKVDSIDEAIEVANDSDFGLGSAIFSKSTDKAKEIAAKMMDSGCCFINDFVKSDPRLPFGGVKESGYGRELSDYGMREFLNIKTVCEN